MRSAIDLRALLRLTALPGVLCFSLLSCGGDAEDAQKSAAIARYVNLVRQSYDDAIADAKSLESAIDALVEKPSADSLEAARQAWIDARPSYLQTEAFRFYEGPIDDPVNGREGRINAWPLDEAFIDYVKDPSTDAVLRNGIINDRGRFASITKALLIAQNGNGGRENIATGYHAIEFLLWGQDFSATEPGQRPFSDYVGGMASPDPDTDRRRQYLNIVTELLIEDLQFTRDAWSDGAPYLKRFLANVNNQSLKNMVTGIASLTKDELADERLRPAYDSQDQEDEHSCFSDNTHNDMKYDLIGIENVYLGRYGSDDGIGLEELVRAADPALDLRIKSEIAAAAQALAAIPVPFDQAIKDTAARRRVRAAIDALDTLNGSLAKLNTTLKL